MQTDRMRESMKFLFPDDDAWYRERVALSKYFAAASGAVITALVVVADKLPRYFLNENGRLFALVILIFGTSALCGFLSYLVSYRGRFYYANFDATIKVHDNNNAWNRFYVKMATIRRPIELVVLYSSFIVATLCFPVGIVLIIYLLFKAYW